MATNILEYSYDYERQPLDDDEALEKYKREKSLHPDALVVLDQFDCGRHWDVKVYKSEEEKEMYLRKRVMRILERVASGFAK
jgi:hypothetical protein